MALPPSSSIRMPARLASGWAVAMSPRRANTGERRELKSAMLYDGKVIRGRARIESRRCDRREVRSMRRQRLRADGVALEDLGIELDAEPGSLRHIDPTVLDRHALLSKQQVDGRLGDAVFLEIRVVEDGVEVQ